MQKGVFVDTYPRAIDTSRRVTIPADFRDVMSGERHPSRLILHMNSSSRSILCHAYDDWENIKKDLEHSGIDTNMGREHLFSICAGLMVSNLDDRGRLPIPVEFLAHARIRRRVVIVGCFDSFEIWSPGNWHHFRAKESAKPGPAVCRLIGF